MAYFKSGEIVFFDFDDGNPAGLMRCEVIKMSRTIGLCHIRIIEKARPSEKNIRSPRRDSARKVSIGHLSRRMK